MAYVPPALRKKQQQSDGNGAFNTMGDNAQPTEEVTNNVLPARQALYRGEDINDYYWPDGNKLDKGSRVTINHGIHYGTLNASAAEPEKLKYVMLFEGANPRWHSDGLIFVKTSLNLLPGGKDFNDSTGVEHKMAGQGVQDQADVLEENDNSLLSCGQESNSDPVSKNTPDLALFSIGPIAVFEQEGGYSGTFCFSGYHKLTRLQFLAPHSQELLRMLEQKFTKVDRFGRLIKPQQRSRSSWEASMSQRWAVMQLEKDVKVDSTLPSPSIKIKKETKDTLPQKSVNELLKDMRLGS